MLLTKIFNLRLHKTTRRVRTAMNSRILLFLCFTILFLPVICTSVSITDDVLTKDSIIQEYEVAEIGRESVSEGLHRINQRNGTPIVLNWLHMFDNAESSDLDESSVFAYAILVPGDLLQALRTIASGGSGPGFLGVLAFSVLSICSGFSVMFVLKKLKLRIITKRNKLIPPKNDMLLSFWASFLNNFPAIARLLLAMIISSLLFLVLATDVTIAGRMFFQAMLGIVFIFTLCTIVTRIIFSPDDAMVRFFNMNETLVKPLSWAVYLSFAILLSGIVLINLFNELGASYQTVTWLTVFVGTLIVIVCGFLIFNLKKPMSQILISEASTKKNSRFYTQLVRHWDRPTILYLLLVWFIWVGLEMSGTVERDGAFIASLLVVPIYFFLSYFGKIFIGSVVDSLALDKKYDDFATGVEDVNEDVGVIVEDKEVVVTKVNFYFRLIVLISLITWILSIWGVDIPYGSFALRAIFESSITLVLAFFCWMIASSFLERKIQEGSPVLEKMEEDDDNEFGGSTPLGRVHTLLPILRKLFGSILLTMVLLIVASSFGVNIGPLLAGAGVIGLAVGFGAQKLVSDILSGFFFLLDDAFRVGEYIQAGAMKGTVETITLRNVLLRHHLGYLQVVPYSDLGAIINYMRGGIVIKFPLEFPYDTDIELVRKIIKRVGEAMIQDEEFGDDFLQPVKSQGVYGITNSVMIIRVKFTAKPGKQFLIRREAFRRITEALNAKGINYAHRKVIVDFPDEQKRKPLDEDAVNKIVEGGAAAAVAAEYQQQKKTEDW